MLNRLKEYINDNEPRILILNDRLNINNYDEIFSLEPSRISIRINNKRIIIKGKDLVLNKMLDKELLIIGKIDSVEVVKWQIDIN